MSIDKINKWYMHRIPNTKAGMTEFLSNAYLLGHEDIKKYESSTGAYPIPNGDSAIIPNWVISNGMFKNNMPEEDKNALTAAFWNNAVLMNAAMKDADYKFSRDTNVRKLSDTGITYAQYAYYLNRSNKLNQTKYKVFSQPTLDYIYNEESLTHAYINWAMGNPQQLGKLVEHYQNPNLREIVSNIVGEEITDILDAILAANSNEELKQLAKNLMDKIVLDPPEPPQSNSNKQSEGDQENQSSGSQSSKQESEDSENQEEQQNSEDSSDGDNDSQDESENGEGQDSSSEDQDGENNSPPMPEGLEDVKPREMKLQNRRAAPEMAEALDKLNDALVASWGTEYPYDGIRITDVMSLRDGYYEIEESDVFSNLGKLMRQIKIIKNKAKTPNWYGQKVLENSLYRIRTDRKIFGTNQQRKQNIKKEWVIGVDLSGSTSYGNLWLKELRAAKGADQSLREARELVSVYGHTTAMGNTCAIIPIARLGDSMLDTRFNKAAHIAKSTNYDYIFLNWLTEHAFVYPDSLKMIIILSDGQPVPYPEGVDFMIDAVRQARRKGFTVFSVSLVKDVVSKNNAIYDEKWNIDASQGNIDQKLRELFLQITLEYEGK